MYRKKGNLQQRDCDHEPGRRAAGVAVIVPLAVNLPGQSLVGHVADEPLREAQPLLLQQGLAAQPAVSLKDGLAEAVGTFVAHQVDKVLVADLPICMAVCESQEHLLFVWVQLRAVALQEAPELSCADVAGASRVKLFKQDFPVVFWRGGQSLLGLGLQLLDALSLRAGGHCGAGAGVLAHGPDCGARPGAPG